MVLKNNVKLQAKIYSANKKTSKKFKKNMKKILNDLKKSKIK